MARFRTEIVFPWELGEVPFLSGGDRDVYTQSGRTTTVSIHATNLRIRPDGRAIMARVFYRIHEDRRNYTTLQYDGDVEITPPPDWPADWRILQILTVSEYRYDNVKISGQHHDWIDDPRSLTRTCVQQASFKIDDIGNDDTGNARLSLTFRIPIMVEGTVPAGLQRPMMEMEPEPAPSPT